MKRVRMTTSLLLFVGLCGGMLAAADGWLTDWEAAKAAAKKTNWPMLVDFSGSDWCTWCIKLDEEVFSTEAFLKGAKDKYILVLLDFPRDKSNQSAAVQKQNKALQKEFDVKGFPTVFLMTPEGKAFAQTGYRKGGPEAYLTHLDELAANRQAVQVLERKLVGSTGLERAKLLDQICDKMSFDGPDKAAYVAEILTLDDRNEAGLRNKYIMQKELPAIVGFLRSGKGPDVVKKCDELLVYKDLPKDARQLLTMLKSNGMLIGGDKEGAKTVLLAAKAIDPDSDIGKNVDRILASELFNPAPAVDQKAPAAKE